MMAEPTLAPELDSPGPAPAPAAAPAIVPTEPVKPVKPVLPPAVLAVATYMNRKGGDGNDFLAQYKAAQAVGGARLQEVDGKVASLASAMQEQIQNSGTYYQHKDILAALKPAQPAKAVASETPVAKPSWQSLHQTPMLKNEPGDKLGTGEDAVHKFLNAAPRFWNSTISLLEDPMAPVRAVATTVDAAMGQASNALANLTDGSGDSLSFAQRRALSEINMFQRLPGQKAGDSPLRGVADKLRHFVDNGKLPEKPMEAAFGADGSFKAGAIPGMAAQALGDLSVIMLTGGIGRVGAAKELAGLARTGNIGGLVQAEKALAATNQHRAFVIGTVQGFQPSLEAGRAAGLTNDDSYLMASVLAPLMGHLDAAAGVESMVNPTVLMKLKGKALEKAVLQAGGELTASNFNTVSKGLISSYEKMLASVAMRGRNFGKAVVAEGVNEGGTQQLAEKGVEQIYNATLGSGSQPGAGKYQQSLAGTAADMANDFVAGGLAGGIGGGTFYRGNLLEPTLYKQIDSAVQSGQDLGMILSGFGPTLNALQKQGVSAEQRSQIEQNIGQMVEVAHGLAAHPGLSPLARYTYYNTSQQLPQFQTQLSGIQDAKAQLPDLNTKLQELDAQPDTAEVIAERAALGQQIAEANARLNGIDENTEGRLGRKIAFLKNARNQVITENKELGIAAPLEYIDRYTEGDSVVDEQGNEHRITAISDDGQMIGTENGQLSAASVRPAGAPVSSLDPAAEVVPPSGLIPFSEKPITDYKAGDGLFFVGQNNQVEQAEFVAYAPAKDGIPSSLIVNLPDGTQTDLDFDALNENGDVLGGYDPRSALEQAENEAQKSELENNIQALRDKLSPDEITALNNFVDTEIPAQIERLKQRGTKTARTQADYLTLRGQQLGVIQPEETSDALASDTPPKSLIYAPEVLTDDEIQGILDTDEVPDLIIDELAQALIEDRQLSEWQTRILEADADRVNEAAYRLTTQILETDEVPAAQTNLADPADSGVTAEPVTPAPARTDDPGPAEAAPDTGPAQTQLESDPVATDQPGPDRDAALDPDGPESGTPAPAQPADSAVSGTATPEAAPSPVAQPATADPAIATSMATNLLDKGVVTPESLMKKGKLTFAQARFALDNLVQAGEAVRDEDYNYSRPPAPAPVETRGTELIRKYESGLPVETVRVAFPIRGQIRAGVLAFRDGMVKVSYEGADKKAVTKYVPVSDILPLTTKENGDLDPVVISGSSPPQNTQTASIGETVTMMVPELGAELRTMEVVDVAPDGLTLTVKSPGTGRTFTAYTDDIEPGATPAPPKDIKDANSRGKIMRMIGTDQPASPVVAPVLNRLIDRLAKAFPNINVEVVSDARMAEDFADASGRSPLGAYQNGIVYLNRDRAGLGTPLHEYSHVWKQIMAEKFPSRWKRGQVLVKASRYETQVRETYPDLKTEDDILEEALVQAIEDQGSRFIDADGNVNIPTPQTAAGRFRTWLNDSFRKLADSTGWAWLSPDTTLEEWASHEAKELLSGNVLSEAGGSELSSDAPAKLSLYPPASPLPTAVDEAFIQSHTLSKEHKKELFDPTIYANSVDQSGNWIRRRRDAVDQSVFRDTQTQLEIAASDKLSPAGIMLDKVLNSPMVQNALDIRVLNKLLIGNETTGIGTMLGSALTAARRRGAQINTQNQEIQRVLDVAIKPYSTYGNRNRRSKVTLEKMTGLDQAGQTVSPEFTKTTLFTVAGQFHSIMADYGGLEERIVNGQAVEGLTVWYRLPGKSEQSDSVFLDKTELRRIEEMFYGTYDPATGVTTPNPEWEDTMDKLDRHFQRTFDPLNQTHLMTEGVKLKQSNSYFPIRVAKSRDGVLISEQELMTRSIGSLVQDAGLLRIRQGRPSEIWAEDVMKVLERYNRNAEQYVHHQPVVQNLKHLSNNFGPELIRMGRGGLKGSLDEIARLLDSPNQGQAKQIKSDTYALLSGSIRLATLARFAFNLGIPLKQVTGLSSAWGNGALGDKYITQAAWPMMRRILKSYALVGRGSKRGNYDFLGGGDTEIDQLLDRVKRFPTIYQRVNGGVNPDVDYANFGGAPEGSEPNKYMYAWAKFVAAEEEYGLAITQRADPAVILSLFTAAEKQVDDEARAAPMSRAEMDARLLDITEQAMYYSNQTYDKTDRSAFQLDSNIMYRMLGLYQGQGFKLFSSMALRNVEVALTKDGTPERGEANKAWAKSVFINVAIGSIVTATIQTLIQGLRKLPSKLWDDKDDKALIEGQEFIDQFMGSTFQNIPVLGDAANYGLRLVTKKPNFGAPFSVQLLEGPVQLVEGVLGGIGDMGFGEFANKKAMQRELAKDAQKAVRGVSETFGITNEVSRQVGNYVKHLIEPEKSNRKQKDKKTGFELMME